MANRYWVGGGSSSNWNATGNTNWGTASNTRDNASVPANGDDVIFDNSANGNSACNISATTNAIKSLTFAGTAGGDYANTLSGSSTIALTTTAAGNVTFSSAMTQSWTGALTFQANSGTCTLTMNGKSLANTLNINGAGGELALGGAFTSSGGISITAGNFTTNGYAVTATIINILTGTGTRVISLGNSTVTVSAAAGNQLVSSATASNYSFAANTASIVSTDSGNMGLNGTSLNGASISITGSNKSLTLTSSIIGVLNFSLADTCDIRFDNGSYINCTGTVTYNSIAYRPINSSSWGDPVPTTPTFAGVTGVDRIGNGAIKVTWAAGTNLTEYRIYARAGSASVFSSTYLVKSVASGITSTILTGLADNDSFLDGTSAIYVGVRAYNDNGNCTVAGTGVEDSNAVTVSITPNGMGSYISVPQEFWSMG